MIRNIDRDMSQLEFNNAQILRRMGELRVILEYSGAYGMGEKYDCLNHKGKRVRNEVEEKFCFQGEYTYCPAPFFFTDTGFGLYVRTTETTEFDFRDGEIIVLLPADCEVFLLSGSPSEMISDFMSLGGKAVLPPDWVFGVWASANRWNSQADVYRLLENMKKYELPSSVIVLEAWSDEATFYIFNGAKYTPVSDGAALSYEAFDFSGTPWPDPKKMIEDIHAAGAKLLLWQVPVYKKQGSDEQPNLQNDLDRIDAEKCGLCVRHSDGSAYTIPEGKWFPGSMIPDFTNAETREKWFAKRQYLLDIGVDGFKTDGGEFVHSRDVLFADGSDGGSMKNRYPLEYTRAYRNFAGDDRVIFSRAGFTPQHTVPIHWAGDQQSLNSELKGALLAGMSASLSGMIFWGFDIAGFAGPLPTLDLYRRAMALACFCPIMQWHSEPDGGQFKLLMPGAEGNNERSPWNMAEAYACPELIGEMRELYRLRERLKPYLVKTAQNCVNENKPMLRPLVYDFPGDKRALNCEDEFMLGDALLVAPLLEENTTSRRVYLPSGEWKSFFTGKIFIGETETEAGEALIPVFIRTEYAGELSDCGF